MKDFLFILGICISWGYTQVTLSTIILPSTQSVLLKIKSQIFLGKMCPILFKLYDFFIKFSFCIYQSYTCTFFKESNNPIRLATKDVLLPTSKSPVLQFSLFRRHLLLHLSCLISIFKNNMLILLYLESLGVGIICCILIMQVALPIPLPIYTTHTHTSCSLFSQFGPLSIFDLFPLFLFLYLLALYFPQLYLSSFSLVSF